MSMTYISRPTTTKCQAFDQDGATATLPLVRRIVQDIRADSRALQDVLPDLKEARQQSHALGAPVPGLAPLRETVADITTRFEACLAELALIGCVYRGTSGHVDFRGEWNGRPVFFCWAPGEYEVSHCHPLGSDCRHRERIEIDAALPVR